MVHMYNRMPLNKKEKVTDATTWVKLNARRQVKQNRRRKYRLSTTIYVTLLTKLQRQKTDKQLPGAGVGEWLNTHGNFRG